MGRCRGGSFVGGGGLCGGGGRGKGGLIGGGLWCGFGVLVRLEYGLLRLLPLLNIVCDGGYLTFFLIGTNNNHSNNPNLQHKTLHHHNVHGVSF